MLNQIRLIFLYFFAIAATTGCTIRLINVPGEQTGFSNVTSMDVTVEASSDITSYAFRVLPVSDPNSDCHSSAPYGSSLVPGTHLIQDLSGFPDGALKLCVEAQGYREVKMFFSIHEQSFTLYNEAVWTKDTVPPGNFQITGPTGTQHIADPTVTWQAASGASTYTLDITSDAACENIYRHYSGIASTSYHITEGIPNGFWHLCVKAEDLATNATPAANNGILMTVDGPFHYLFATSTEFNGAQVTSLTDADYACTMHAFVGNLIPDWNGEDLVYKAILSDSTTHAKDRIVLDRSIFNRNNQYVAFGNELWSNPLAVAIAYDENAFLLGAAQAWTGSNADGTYAGDSCSDWSSTSGTSVKGRVDAISSAWIADGTANCSSFKRLYCIGPF